jgi:hypothetical protein
MEREVPLWETKPQGGGLSVATTLSPNTRPDPVRCQWLPRAMNGPGDAATLFVVFLELG